MQDAWSHSAKGDGDVGGERLADQAGHRVQAAGQVDADHRLVLAAQRMQQR